MKPLPAVIARGHSLVEQHLENYPDVDEIGWVLTQGTRVYAGSGSSRRFRIASMTKSFTAATVVAVCREELGLSLGTPLREVLPEVSSSLGEATVEHALTMTTGLPTDDAWADRLEAMSRVSFAELISRPLILNQAPGVNYEYSNLGYALLGLVVERVAGRSFQDLLQNYVLDPLRLEDVSLVSSAARVQGRHRNLDGTLRDVEATTLGAFSPIGGLWATPTGIGHWISHLRDARYRYLQGSSLAKYQFLLKRVQDPRVFHRVATGDKSVIYEGYGYGLHYRWDTRLGEVLFHSGGYPGFGSHMRWHTATGLGIAVMGNQTYFPAEDIAKPVLEEIVLETGYLPIRPREKAASVAAFEETAPVAEKNLDAFFGLLDRWDPSIAATIFSPNVFQDRTEREFHDLIEECIRRDLAVSVRRSRTEVILAPQIEGPRLQILFNPVGEIQKMTWQESGHDTDQRKTD